MPTATKPYTFNPQPGGLIQVIDPTGKVLGTGTDSYAGAYGYAPSTSTVKTEPSSISSDKSQAIADYKDKITGLSSQPPKGSYITTPTPNGPMYQSTATQGDTPDLKTQREQSGTFQGLDGKYYYVLDASPASDPGGASASGGTDEYGLPTGDPVQYALDTSTRIYNEVMKQADPMTQNLIRGIQAQYGMLMEMQKKVNAGNDAAINTVLERSGSNRYSPLSATGINTTQISAGAMALAELQRKEDEAILAAQNAAQTNAWNRVGSILNEVDKIRTSKISLAKQQSNDLANQVRQANIGQAVSSLIDSQGTMATPKSILDAMNSSTSFRALNASTKDVQEAYADLVGSPEKLGQDWEIYQKMIQAGEIPQGTPFMSGADSFLSQMATAKTESSLLQQRALNVIAGQLKATGYINLPTSVGADGLPTVSEKDVKFGQAYKLASNAVKDKRTDGQVFSDFIASRDYESAFSLTLKNAIQTSPAAIEKKMTDYPVAIQQLKVLDADMKEIVAAGGDTNVITGSFEDINRKIGKTTNPLFAKLKSDMNSALFGYRQALTGVQFSYKEGEMYTSQFPSYWNDNGLNEVLVSSLANYMYRSTETFYSQQFGPDLYGYMKQEARTPDISTTWGIIDPNVTMGSASAVDDTLLDASGAGGAGRTSTGAPTSSGINWETTPQ